jgi:ankyrin repeat protein
MQIHASAARGDIDGVARQLAKGVPVDLLDPVETPLVAAARSKYAGVDMLRFLVEHGADVNAVSHTSGENSDPQYTPLMRAAAGSLEKTRFLLEAGANPHYVTPAGYTALLNAVFNSAPSQLEIVKLLLAAGADPNAVTSYNESALNTAVYVGNFEMVRLLLDSGADPTWLDWNDLMRAVALGTVEEVAEMLQKGADVNAPNKRCYSPWTLSLWVGDLAKCQLLHQHGAGVTDKDLFAAVANDHPDVVKWLLGLGLDVNVRDDFAATPLMRAAERGSTNCVPVLLDAGADVGAQNQIGATAITHAANPDIARMLVEAGANINDDSGGYTLLKLAVEGEDEALVRAALDMGADTEVPLYSEKPLYLAARADNLVIARMLLKAGANPNGQNVDGWFPLEQVRSVEMAALLLDGGADITLSDGNGAEVLESINDPEVVRYLVSRGARVNTPSQSGSPLMKATDSYNIPMMKVLLEHSADVNRATAWGKTALMIAAEHNFTEGTRLLIEAGANLELRDEDGRTALFYAAAPEGFTAYKLMMEMQNPAWMQNLPEETRKLLEAEGESRPRFTYGYVESDSVEVLELLVQKGADINARDNSDMTALMLAASCGRPARVWALLALGADATLKDAAGKTAYIHAGTHPNEAQRAEILGLLRL